MIPTELRSEFNKARALGKGCDGISLTESEVAWLLAMVAADLDLSLLNADLRGLSDAAPGLYAAGIPPALPSAWASLTADDLLEELAQLLQQEPDVRLYFRNLCEIHKRRIKFQRILSSQPKPTMDQIGPRSLLEHGVVPANLLGTWLMWRKWIFDVDNRSGQETGYLFEPLLASCMGGVAVGSQRSPVTRISESGRTTTEGRQIDCLDASARIAYEFKLRVSIAASGQGRFAEELSFPVECRASGLTPVLLVLDPTPSSRLSELRRAFEDNGGEVHVDDAWEFIERKAGKCMSRFIEIYLRPVLLEMTPFDDTLPNSLRLSWDADAIALQSGKETFTIRRNGSRGNE